MTKKKPPPETPRGSITVTVDEDAPVSLWQRSRDPEAIKRLLTEAAASETADCFVNALCEILASKDYDLHMHVIGCCQDFDAVEQRLIALEKRVLQLAKDQVRAVVPVAKLEGMVEGILIRLKELEEEGAKLEAWVIDEIKK